MIVFPLFRATIHVEEPRSTGLEETGSFYRDIKSWLSSKPEKRRRSLDGRGERIDRIISGEVIQQEELATVKEISQAWLAMVDDQCCIKYEGRKEK